MSSCAGRRLVTRYPKKHRRSSVKCCRPLARTSSPGRGLRVSPFQGSAFSSRRAGSAESTAATVARPTRLQATALPVVSFECPAELLPSVCQTSLELGLGRVLHPEEERSSSSMERQFRAIAGQRFQLIIGIPDSIIPHCLTMPAIGGWMVMTPRLHIQPLGVSSRSS
jgi:hypothetical protein